MNDGLFLVNEMLNVVKIFQRGSFYSTLIPVTRPYDRIEIKQARSNIEEP